ncbi:MAG: BtrH N-terminal domain-containing protein [Akkermansiaceae bacterium]
MILPNFQPFYGEHCETVALGNLLKHHGLNLSEPMLFGLGSGLGFIYWKMKTMPLPFLGGRTKNLTQNLCGNLDFELKEQETTSQKRAWKNVTESLALGTPVALQLDCFHLEYFTQKIHFAGHYVAMYGYDKTHAYLVDTQQQGGAVKTTLENLAKARSAKGPMSARNRSVTVSFDPAQIDIEFSTIKAIRRNAQEFLNPPIKNLGYKGILKTSEEIKHWYANSSDLKNDFSHAATMIEKAGTGGAMFRNLYRDFLQEAYELFGKDCLADSYEEFTIIAEKWTKVSNFFIQIAETKSEKPLHAAAGLLREISHMEREAMQHLSRGLSDFTS